jgi:hypothetical protein
MFEMLRRFSSRIPQPTARRVDPWANSGSYYVALFHTKLDKIADAISHELEQTVQTRFNPALKCAELFGPGGDVLVRVVVHGEAGSPYEAIVTYSSISDVVKELFIKTLPVDVKFRTAS